MTKQYEGMRVYVVSLDGAKTPARLVGVLEGSAVVKYSHMTGLFTYDRSIVIDEQGDTLEYYKED